jgi:predicted O-methyltransferase YrrM
VGAMGAIRTVAEHLAIPIQRERLRLAGHEKLARALDRRPPAIMAEIERLRAGMKADHSPLICGLEPPGIYDEGQSVAAAARVSRRGSSARLLHSIAAEYEPTTILELGTNVGISAAYLAAGGGNVTTLDVSPYRLALAKKLHYSLGLKVDYVCGLFSDTLPATLDRLPPVEMAFIDGHHQYQPTLDYYAMIAEQAASGCIYVFDDIRWSEGMRRSWEELRPKFKISVDLGGMGICI